MTDTAKQTPDQTINNWFPLPVVREKQAVGLGFIQRAVARGYRHVVLSAPTGTGKSPIGVAVSHWVNSGVADLEGADGAYYLVTQKMLQTQLERDAEAYQGLFKNLRSVKSSTEYPCPRFKTCGLGSRVPSKGKQRACYEQNHDNCPYKIAKALFESSTTAVTNYPYFFSEKVYVGQLPKRKAIILDECHNLASQAVRFVDAKISQQQCSELSIPIKVPELNSMDEFLAFSKPYLGVIDGVLKIRLDSDAMYDDKMAKSAVDLERHACKIRRAVDEINEDRGNWVFWKSPLREGGNEFVARPLEAAGFMDSLVNDAADLKLYMSAYPGSKDGFCRELGLSQDDVAWAELDSSFPVENRPIVMAMVGSMGMKNVDATMPAFLRLVGKILGLHANEKGLIHCNSYKLGEAVMRQFSSDPRLIFPRNSTERDAAFLKHATSPDPTVLVSPSMTEGYDFADDLARWQIIAKVPYPNLGDAWVAAKKARDENWYAQCTVSTIVQATGRIVRSDADRGLTYILDSDFDHIWRRHQSKFPAWWRRAVVWP